MELSKLKIVTASDHAGYEMKEHIKKILKELNIEVIDLGPGNGEESVDYPDFGFAAGKAVAKEKNTRGIIVCGSGIGISIAANKVKGIRAALCCDETAAALSRKHNDANILVMAGRPFTPERAELAGKMIKTWIETPFEGGRHQIRIDKISRFEQD